VDVGTGSGILAVVLAKELPQAQVIAVDRSEAALKLARENARRQGVRIFMVQCDLVGTFAPKVAFEVIVSNPPYVPTAVWEQLPREIKEYEPRLALDGGPDGLEIIRALAAAAPALLRPGGLLALEVGQGQAEMVQQLLDLNGAYSPAAIIPDYQRIGRVVLARRVVVEGGETGAGN
jgi:release factor glutamine methyltransferase